MGFWRGWVVLVCLLLGCVQAWAAVVPDGSVVRTEEQAPRLPVSEGDNRSASKVPPGSKSSPRPTSHPVPPAPSQANPGNSSSSSAFGGTSATEGPNPGESQPLQPLAPAPVSSGSTTPLWAALVVFLFLALGGLWLAQQRSQD